MQRKEENGGLLLSLAESWLSRQQKEEEGLSSNLSVFSQITVRRPDSKVIEFLHIFDHGRKTRTKGKKTELLNFRVAQRGHLG